MNKRTKIVTIALVLLLAVGISGISAQEGGTPDLLEVENSMFMGYDFAGTGSIAQAFRFGVNLSISESLEGGVLFQQAGPGTNNAAYLRLKYTLMDRLGLALLYGVDNAVTSAAGAQVSYDLLRNDVQEIATILSINLEYIVPDITAGVETGTAGASLVLGFGI